MISFAPIKKMRSMQCAMCISNEVISNVRDNQHKHMHTLHTHTLTNNTIIFASHCLYGFPCMGTQVKCNLPSFCFSHLFTRVHCACMQLGRLSVGLSLFLATTNLIKTMPEGHIRTCTLLCTTAHKRTGSAHTHIHRLSNKQTNKPTNEQK